MCDTSVLPLNLAHLQLTSWRTMLCTRVYYDADACSKLSCSYLTSPHRLSELSDTSEKKTISYRSA